MDIAPESKYQTGPEGDYTFPLGLKAPQLVAEAKVQREPGHEGGESPYNSSERKVRDQIFMLRSNRHSDVENLRDTS